MRKYLVYMIATLSVVAVVLTFTSIVRAEGAAKNTAAAKPKAPSATGEIATVDAKAGTLSIKRGDATLTFTIAKDCKVSTAGKKEAAVTDLKVGDKVTVAYTEEGGVKVAQKIKPHVPKPAAK